MRRSAVNRSLGPQKSKLFGLPMPGSSGPAASNAGRLARLRADFTMTTASPNPSSPASMATRRPPWLSWSRSAAGISEHAPSRTMASYGPLAACPAVSAPVSTVDILDSCCGKVLARLRRERGIAFERHDVLGEFAKQQRRVSGQAADIEHTVADLDVGELHKLRKRPWRQHRPPRSNGDRFIHIGEIAGRLGYELLPRQSLHRRRDPPVRDVARTNLAFHHVLALKRRISHFHTLPGAGTGSRAPDKSPDGIFLAVRPVLPGPVIRDCDAAARLECCRTRPMAGVRPSNGIL